jgi:hypothetical protein
MQNSFEWVLTPRSADLETFLLERPLVCFGRPQAYQPADVGFALAYCRALEMARLSIAARSDMEARYLVKCDEQVAREL